MAIALGCYTRPLSEHAESGPPCERLLWMLLNPVGWPRQMKSAALACVISRSAEQRNDARPEKRAALPNVRTPSDVAGAILGLQTSHGNAFVGRLLQRRPDRLDPSGRGALKGIAGLIEPMRGGPGLARAAADPFADVFEPASFASTPEAAAAVTGLTGVPGFDDGAECRYEPGEKAASAADPGDASLTSGLVPNALEQANENRRFFLAQALGVDPDQLDAELERQGLPPAPPAFTPALRGELTLTGFTQGSAELKGRHLTFLRERVPELGLDAPTPRYRVDRIEGFSDCVDSFATNVGIRRARASEARVGLLVSGALEGNVGPAVASQAAAREPDQSTPAGRAANRAAVVHLELVAAPKPEPKPEIPDQTQPTCEMPSDDWSFSTIAMASGGLGFGGAVLTMAFINNRTSCFHTAVFVGVGFAGPGVGISMSTPSSSDLPPLVEESFSFQLSGAGDLFFAEIGAGPGRMVGRLVMSGGALGGLTLDVGGFQLQTPGADLGAIPGFLFVNTDGTRL